MTASIDSVITTLKGWLPLKNPPSYAAGLNPYRSKQWQTAQHYFEKALRERPNHAASHFKLGMCYFRQQAYEQANEYISRALALSPDQVQWQEQLQQVQRYTANQEDTENGLEESAGKDTQTLVATIQLALLNADYTKAAEQAQWVETLLGESSAHRATLKKVRHLACEAALMQPESPLTEALAALDEKDPARYTYNAIAQYYQGEIEQALAEFQLSGNVSANPDIAYWYASVLAAMGDNTAAWDLLENTSRTSRRVATWQNLAALVKKPAQLQRYLLVLEQWCAKSPSSRHHRDIAVATAQAALTGGNGMLARKTLHDSIEFHQKRAGGPSAVLPEAIINSQEPGAPRWVVPFAALPANAIQQSIAPRMWQALAAVMEVADATSTNPVALQNTFQWLLSQLRNEPKPTLVLGIDAGENAQQLQRALSQQSNLIKQGSDSDACHYLHANGIAIVIVVINADEDSHTYQYQQATYTHSLISPAEYETNGVRCYVPANTNTYFEESGIAQNERVDDWLLQARNKAIDNQDAYVAHAYQAWLHALVYEATELEGLAVRELRNAGEHKQSYQRQLHNFTIPDADTIRQDGIKVVLYVSGLDKVGYQANMWIPVLEKLSQPAAIVIREKRIAEELVETTLPVYFMKTMRDVEYLEEADVKVVLYPANTQKNIHTLRFHRMQHYFINHGESDKVVNQSKFLMAYDKLLVAGPLAERRLKEANLPLRENQVVHVGRPQVELLLNQVNEPTTQVHTILYAPTWEGFVEEANYASVSEFGYQMLKQLAENKRIKVLFKPHPYTGYNQAGTCGYYLDEMIKLCDQESNLEYVDASEGIHRYMNQSDMLITDISSVLNEYLYTQKPIVLCNVQHHDQDILESQFSSSKAAYLLQRGDEIANVVTTVESEDGKFEARRLTCKDSLGYFPEGYMRQFNSVVEEGIKLTISKN